MSLAKMAHKKIERPQGRPASWRWILPTLVIAILAPLHLDALIPVSKLFLHGVIGYIFIYPTTLLHELGHALAGTLAGVKIGRIQTGTGRDLYTTKIFDIEFVFKSGFGGCVTPEKYPLNHVKFSHFTMFMGGMVMDLAVALLYFLNMDSRWSDSMELHGFYLPHVLLVVQLRDFYLSAIPKKVLLNGKYMDNDMAQMLQIPYMGPADVEYLNAMPIINQANEVMVSDRYSEAEEIYRNGLLSFPNSATLKIALAAALISQGKSSEALSLLSELQDAMLHAELRPIMHLNLATAYILSCASKDAEKALNHLNKLSEEDEPKQSIKIIRALALIDIAEVDQGVKILQDMVEIDQPIDIEKNCMTSHAYLAYGYMLQNKQEPLQVLVNKIRSADWPQSKFDSAILSRIMERTRNFEGLNPS